MPLNSMRSKLSASLMLVAAILSIGAGKPDAPPIVVTTNGPVEGFYKGAAAEFLGIPYAAPPVGPLRWKPPENPASWQATRPAKAFGPTCAQINELGVFAGPANSNEDCLYLNVFAPVAAVNGRGHLPVFVWVYGGGYVDGESNDYDGYKLAVKGNAIVVTINYRLNLFGFLAHPALDQEGHLFANYAMLDQQFALKWVKANIASFGGDPANVTLGGQSAGGSSTGIQLVSPYAKGLFHKAIIQSAGSYLTATPLEQAEAKGTAFAKAAGCGAGSDAATAACLRALPAEAILKLAGSSTANSAFVQSAAIRDGQIVPSGTASAFASGRFTRMPIMNGTVQDEGGFFTGNQMYGTGGPPWKTITQDDVTSLATSIFGADHGAAVLQHYPAQHYATAQLRSNAIQSDAFVCKSHHATRLLAGQVPLYVYEFRDRTAPSYYPDMPGFEPLAYHTSELQYLFPGYHGASGVLRPLSASQERLSDRMVTAWMNFARTGNPNGAGNKPWPAYLTTRRTFMAFELAAPATISDSQFTANHQCDFWDGVLTYN